ncbi:hypothetical protein [Halorussus litoreus]|uniref:hypothetical protein n=1 Tax=Halorussus litoreus TaxID=1710536 RepID=UPI000E24CDB1|nr:hypothetical protein [Halorussus litoreus]
MYERPRNWDVTSDDSPPTRRAYLRAAGATAAAAALAGCAERDPGTSSPTDSPPPGTTGTPGSPTAETTAGDPATGTTETQTIESVDRADYETVVNVAEEGADTSGEEPVNPILDEHVGDDTLLYFPPGRYRLTDWRVVDYRNLGVVGTDATFVPPDGHRSYWFQWGQLRDFTFAGVTIDNTAEGVAPTIRLSTSGGRNVVRDVEIEGHRRAPRIAFEIDAVTRDTELLFENVRLPDGSTDGHAIYVFPQSVGDLTFRDCHVEHWWEGLYASYHSGPLRVLGGYYANNGIEQVRVGGGKTGAVVRGVTVRVDNPQQGENKPNMRGIWAEEGAQVRIEDCDIAITDLTGTYSSGGIVIGKQFGRATIENTRVRTDVNAPGINVRNPVNSMEGQTIPSMDSLPDDWRVDCRNVRVEGSAASGTAVMTTRRDDCQFEGLCITHSEGSRNGIGVNTAEGCSVRNSTIAVSGEAITTEDATVETEGVRTGGSC